ncbi:hypothetical protein ABZ891_12680 [Streptomyces sp. NPDC047023]|uniref:hypothetical protein n=1 Tax=Streptomyces sp. NPDC047023 TaxID=3155139 RepID=UPI00340D0E05
MTKPPHLYPKPAGLDHDDVLKPRPGSERITAEVEREVAESAFASGDTFRRWRATLGPARAATLLYDCWSRGLIVKRTLRQHVGSIWHTADIPDYWLGHGQWRELFDAAGYTRVPYSMTAAVDVLGSEIGEAVERPTRPITVYRGSISGRRDDWSWTANPVCAARWASGTLYNRPLGRIWMATASPERLLCRIDRWDQYVVDTTDLDIREYEGTPS